MIYAELTQLVPSSIFPCFDRLSFIFYFLIFFLGATDFHLSKARFRYEPSVTSSVHDRSYFAIIIDLAISKFWWSVVHASLPILYLQRIDRIITSPCSQWRLARQFNTSSSWTPATCQTTLKAAAAAAAMTTMPTTTSPRSHQHQHQHQHQLPPVPAAPVAWIQMHPSPKINWVKRRNIESVQVVLRD